MKKLTAEQINELLKLDDDALLDTHEAAAVVGLAANTLNWFRSNAPECGPKPHPTSTRTIRYRMGACREYLSLPKERKPRVRQYAKSEG